MDVTALKLLEGVGVFVVVSRHSVSPERVLGVAVTLSGATAIALDSDVMPEMLVEAEEGAWTKVPADSNDKRARDQFTWKDEGLVIWGVSDFTKGHIGSQAMEAYFQDEATGIYVHWAEFRIAD